MRTSLTMPAGRKRRLWGPPVARRLSCGRHRRRRVGRGWLTTPHARHGQRRRRPGFCALINLVSEVVNADHALSQHGCDTAQPTRDGGHAGAGQEAFITDSPSTAQLHGSHRRVVSGSDYALLPLAPHESNPATTIRCAVSSGMGPPCCPPGCGGSTSLDAQAGNSEPECS